MTAPVVQQQAQARIAAASSAAAAAVASVRAARVSVSVGAAADRAAGVFGKGSSADTAQAVGAVVNANAAAVQTAVKVTSAAIERLWHATDPYDDTAMQDFAAQAGRLVVSAQRSVVRTTNATQAIVARTVGLRVPGAVDVPDDVRGAHVSFGADDVTVRPKSRVSVTYQPEAKGDKPTRVTVTAADARPDQIFNRAAVVYRYQESQGASPEAASRASVQRIDDIVDGNLMLAQRLAEQQTMKQAGATHYRRVIHPELSKGGVCGLCVVASDRLYKIEALKPIHLRCKCTVVPADESSDLGLVLNRDDFKMLYSDAGVAAQTGDGRYTSAHFEAHIASVEERRKKRGRAPLGKAYWDQVAQTHSDFLKKGRYDVIQHAEFGPVLVRKGHDPVPYFHVAAAA